MDITSSLGLALAKDKCSPPTSGSVWLGFKVDAPLISVTVPQDKLVEVVTECEAWKLKKTASRRQLQSIAGKLQHIAKCVKPARRLTNHILAAIRFAPLCKTVNTIRTKEGDRFLREARR